MTTPTPPVKRPIETKVKVATIATYVGVTVLLGVLEGFNGDANLIKSLPDWLEPFLVPLIPTAITYFSAYKANHTPRPDLGQS